MPKHSMFILGIGFLLAACNDPKDPQTWIKKLRDVEHGPEAVRRLQEIGDPVAVMPLCELYKDFPSVNILKAIISFKDKRSIPTLINALDFTEENYNNATTAAMALANLKATEAVEALGKILERPIPLKSRANKAKIAAIEALAQIGDKKAVPYLIAALEKKVEEQDFFVHKKATEALGELGDPQAIPVLIQALFMASTLQGSAFPQARVAMVRMGMPAVQPLLDALNGKNEKLNTMAKELEFKEGVILQKTSLVLGDLMAAAAFPAILNAYSKASLEVKDDNMKGLDGVIEALGKIGDARAIDPLIKGLTNTKANYKIRMQICQALTILGAKKALPALLSVAESGFIEGGYTNLVESAAMAYGRIVGAEAESGYAKMAAIMKNDKLKAQATQDLFKEVLERIDLAKECKDDALCYGKKINDEKVPLVKREKAGIMIGILPEGRKALADLTKAVQIREPILRLFFLQSAKRIGVAKDVELVKTIETLAEKDSKRTVAALGADLTSEDRVALAVIKSKE